MYASSEFQTHALHHCVWEHIHDNPRLYKKRPPQRIQQLVDWMNKKSFAPPKIGIYTGCGKGDEVIRLVEEYPHLIMTGVDFSISAIRTANRQARVSEIENRAKFQLQDVTITPWKFKSTSSDICIDCVSDDIESPEKRATSASELTRVLKPNGLLAVYLPSPDQKFYRDMILQRPAREANAFFHLEGRFEKTFTKQEIIALYPKLQLQEVCSFQETHSLLGIPICCSYQLMIFQKPQKP